MPAARGADSCAAPRRPRATPRRKLSYKEQRELDELPARIESLEAEQKSLAELLSGSALYTDTPQRVSEVQSRYDAIEHELTELLERWERLSSVG